MKINNKKKFKDIPNFNADRLVFLFDSFYEYSCEKIINKLFELDSINSNDIFIVINSPGGVVSDLTAILDTIKGIESKVNTICLGQASSCGAILLANGGARYAGEKSEIMFHEVSAWLVGTTTELEEQLQSVKKVQDELFASIEPRLNTNLEEFKNKLKKYDYSLTAEEALEIGIIDEIIGADAIENIKNNIIQMTITNYKKEKEGEGMDEITMKKDRFEQLILAEKQLQEIQAKLTKLESEGAMLRKKNEAMIDLEIQNDLLQKKVVLPKDAQDGKIFGYEELKQLKVGGQEQLYQAILDKFSITQKEELTVKNEKNNRNEENADEMLEKALEKADEIVNNTGVAYSRAVAEAYAEFGIEFE